MKKNLHYQEKKLSRLSTAQISYLLDQFETAFVFFDWENQTLKLCLGVAAECFPAKETKQNQFLTVKNWYQTLKTDWNTTITTAAPLIAGSFLFDPLKKTTAWAGLAAGYFFLPQLMISQNSTQTIAISCASTVKNGSRQLSRLQACLAAAKKTTGRAQIQQVSEVQVASWQQTVQQAVAAIQAQRLAKVVLARQATVTLNQSLTAGELWQRLALIKQQNYQFLLKYQDQIFISLTPEKLAEFQPHQLRVDALAGTTARGDTLNQQQELGERLLQSTKNRIEHQIVVAEITHRLQELALKIEHPTEPQLLATGSVQHLYTPITAYGEVDPWRVLAQLHPTPALGGQPQQAALKFIRDFEGWDRGLFGGPTGWLDFTAKGKFTVAIRSALLTGLQVHLFAGAGIVADSDYQQETIETHNKMQPMLKLLKGRKKNERK
ncbi:MAG: isochorismate synthase [Liquorilactobacillus nagelii]|uniref:isochorismate synthase n=1 Tax=Liquorilactobacillus nagelii TaxID=82688 RepID=A0A3Q8D028_9LACO|nr:isochorismate synthase [Liquorilactobacillus nagelii]AUJ31664.1 hypothetical protein BSQ50_03275 [Liquorilactobacillus nagelii]MCP9314277.1 isochorismate synthase [Liquorilactobacillus nagelii]